MSGGSYDYLCQAYELQDLVAKRRNLEKMAERLERLPWAKDAAIETRRLISDLQATEVRAEAAMERLRGVWKAVEWWDSSDSSEEAVREALDAYRSMT